MNNLVPSLYCRTAYFGLYSKKNKLINAVTNNIIPVVYSAISVLVTVFQAEVTDNKFNKNDEAWNNIS